jgi:hypothetical protein
VERSSVFENSLEMLIRVKYTNFNSYRIINTMNVLKLENIVMSVLTVIMMMAVLCLTLIAFIPYSRALPPQKHENLTTIISSNNAGVNVTNFTYFYNLIIKGKTYLIGYNITGGNLIHLAIDTDKKSLIATINYTTGKGRLIIELPRNIIDSKNRNRIIDDNYAVFIDGHNNVDFDEINNNNQSRILAISFDKGTLGVEIAGTQILMEATPNNLFPIANAGIDQTVNENTTNVTLKGIKSYDKDGKLVSYLWKQTSGPTVILSNPTTVDTTFTSPPIINDTVLRFNLTVTDNDKSVSTPSTVAVTIKNVNIPPIANAGTDQTVNERTTGINLNGTESYDKDGIITSYKWQQLSGPNVILSGSNTNLANFSAPAVKANTSLAFKLITTDNINASSSAATSVLVKNVNIPPVANAGNDLMVNESTTVLLNGNKSRDPDGTIKSYAWKQIAGSYIRINGNNTLTPTFVTPNVTTETPLAFRLTVTDDNGASDFSNMNILVKNVNHRPIANAGNDLNATRGNIVTLDGTRSTDPDGDSLRKYTWTQISGPSNVNITQNGNASQLTFRALDTGINNTVLEFRLVVNDGQVDSNPDSVNVTVKGVLQSVSDNAPSNYVVSAKTNASLSVFTDQPFTEEDSGQPITVYGRLGNVVSQSGISGEGIDVHVITNKSGSASNNKQKEIFQLRRTTDANGNYEIIMPGSKKPAGSYIVSAEANSSRYGLKNAIVEFRVLPHSITWNDVAGYIGVAGVILGIVLGIGPPLFRRLQEKSKRRSLSRNIEKIDDIYNRLYFNERECLCQFENFRHKLVQLLDKGEIDPENYGILDKKVSDYIDKIKKS